MRKYGHGELNVVRELAYPLSAALAKGPCKVSHRSTTRNNPITRILAFKTTWV